MQKRLLSMHHLGSCWGGVAGAVRWRMLSVCWSAVCASVAMICVHACCCCAI